MKQSFIRFAAVAALVLLVSIPGYAQVTREEGTGTVAGVLGETGDAHDDYTFTSHGNEILTASVDAQVYVSQQSSDHHDPAAAEAHEDGEDCGGGEEGGPGGLCLQVINSFGEVLCWATRPATPGWQRDPRLICRIPQSPGKPGDYTLRVSVRDDNCGDRIYSDPTGERVLPYLLNVSLRTIAPEGKLSPAIAASRSHL